MPAAPCRMRNIEEFQSEARFEADQGGCLRRLQAAARLATAAGRDATRVQMSTGTPRKPDASELLEVKRKGDSNVCN